MITKEQNRSLLTPYGSHLTTPYGSQRRNQEDISLATSMKRDGVPEPLTGGHHARKTPQKRKQRTRRQVSIRRKEESADKEALRDCFERRYKTIGKPLWLKDLHATTSLTLGFWDSPEVRGSGTFKTRSYTTSYIPKPKKVL